jgi:hypothetical protein
MSPKRKVGEGDVTAARVAAQVETQQASDFKLIYANFVQSIFSPLDVALTFGEIMGAEGDKVYVLTKARVTMTPAEAKILQMIVAKTVGDYEEKFGEISVPSVLMPPK